MMPSTRGRQAAAAVVSTQPAVAPLSSPSSRRSGVGAKAICHLPLTSTTINGRSYRLSAATQQSSSVADSGLELTKLEKEDRHTGAQGEGVGKEDVAISGSTRRGTKKEVVVGKAIDDEEEHVGRRRSKRSRGTDVSSPAVIDNGVDGEGEGEGAPTVLKGKRSKKVKVVVDVAVEEEEGGKGGKGVKRKTKVVMKEGEEMEKEEEAPSLDTSWEKRLEAKGYKYIYGIDEAGRGPLAGPVVAAACFIPSHVKIPGILDSKVMNEEQRETAYDKILQAEGVRWAVHVVDNQRIDEINILQATMEAMRFALATKIELHGEDDASSSYILIDGNRSPTNLPTIGGGECVIKGDSKVRAIAAASILAKVTRDRIMVKYHETYPQYNFIQHKGYPTPGHKAALIKHGPCPIHRMTFAPIKKKSIMIEEEEEEKKERGEEEGKCSQNM